MATIWSSQIQYGLSRSLPLYRKSCARRIGSRRSLLRRSEVEERSRVPPPPPPPPPPPSKNSQIPPPPPMPTVVQDVNQHRWKLFGKFDYMDFAVVAGIILILQYLYSVFLFVQLLPPQN